MRIHLNTSDWRIGYYRDAHHHYLCPLPCLAIRIRRRGHTSSPASVEDCGIPPITSEELVADAHAAIAETDWTDHAAALSMQSYLGQLQMSLPVTHQLAMCRIRISDIDTPMLAVASDAATWSICIPGVGLAKCADLDDAAAAAWSLIQQQPQHEGGERP